MFYSIMIGKKHDALHLQLLQVIHVNSTEAYMDVSSLGGETTLIKKFPGKFFDSLISDSQYS